MYLHGRYLKWYHVSTAFGRYAIVRSCLQILLEHNFLHTPVIIVVLRAVANVCVLGP